MKRSDENEILKDVLRRLGMTEFEVHYFTEHKADHTEQDGTIILYDAKNSPQQLKF